MNVHRVQQGFSLIELMIAMLIGLLLLIGITSLFNTTAGVNRMENGLARLQESGRFALDRIAEDIRMATAARGSRKASEGAGPGQVNPDRPLISFVDLGSGAYQQHGLPGAAAAGGATRYMIPPTFMLRGHECTTSCAPVLGAANVGSDVYNRPGYGQIPALGSASGNRAQGADVLTLRYLRGEGTPLAQRLTGLLEGNAIVLSEPLTLGPSRLLVVGDYATTSIVSVNQTGPETFVGAGNLTDAQTAAFDIYNDARISDFDADFLTVSYYLRLDDDPSRPGRLISSLRRRENGVDVSIAEGIERLDFIYHAEDNQGRIRPMTAAQVASAAACPAASLNPPLPPAMAALDAANCGWRSVRAIEVYLLANTIDDAGANQEPFQYSFLTSGAANTAATVEVACDPAYNSSCPGAAVQTLASGLPPGKMLRREFRTVVAIRNNAF